MIKHPYNICVIDIGSPKLGNLGWCMLNTRDGSDVTGMHLDDLFSLIEEATRDQGMILGLEAPLFVPIRPDLLLATKARRGEGRRPWSAGAGAQVLAMNLPIMVYLFKGLQAACPHLTYHLNEETFTGDPGQVMVFEALVSGADKGISHIDDAQIMTRYCARYALEHALPPSILEPEDDTTFFNLAAAALLRCGLLSHDTLGACTPIYKPTAL